MKSRQKILRYIGAALALLVCIGAVQLARGEISLIPDSGQAIAADLAALSGLPEDTVSQLYQATQSWTTVRDNIFVYRKILTLVPAEMSESEAIFTIMKEYDPDKILAVCEFLTENGNDFTLLAEILAAQADGQELGQIFAENLADKTYAVYQPATEKQVEAWLAAGYLPADILAADQIAREKDMAIQEVMSSKTEYNTWEEIAAHYKTPLTSDDNQDTDAEAGRTLNEDNVPAQTGSAASTDAVPAVKPAPDYTTQAQQARIKADQKKTELQDQITKDNSVSEEQLKACREQGFNDYEINNACRLAKAAGTDIQTVLDYKKQGATWEETIKHFSRPERQESL